MRQGDAQSQWRLHRPKQQSEGDEEGHADCQPTRKLEEREEVDASPDGLNPRSLTFFCDVGIGMRERNGRATHEAAGCVPTNCRLKTEGDHGRGNHEVRQVFRVAVPV